MICFTWNPLGKKCNEETKREIKEEFNAEDGRPNKTLITEYGLWLGTEYLFNYPVRLVNGPNAEILKTLLWIKTKRYPNVQ